MCLGDHSVARGQECDLLRLFPVLIQLRFPLVSIVSTICITVVWTVFLRGVMKHRNKFYSEHA